jgi:hypothetical protein
MVGGMGGELLVQRRFALLQPVGLPFEPCQLLAGGPRFRGGRPGAAATVAP